MTHYERQLKLAHELGLFYKEKRSDLRERLFKERDIVRKGMLEREGELRLGAICEVAERLITDRHAKEVFEKHVVSKTLCHNRAAGPLKPAILRGAA